ncbi:MAG: hypothetical protein RL701_7138 [Pseudomonadota bacterium]
MSGGGSMSMTYANFSRTRARTLGWFLICVAGIACDGAQTATSPDAASSDAGQAGSDAGKPGCVVDFPCFDRVSRCVGDRQLRKLKTVGCSAFCSGLCTGAACVPGAIEECADGQVCMEVRSGSAQRASCVASSDAGLCGPESDMDDDAGRPCRPVRGCGDGIRDYLEFGEDCDDGNRTAGDGCDRDCNVERG